MGLLTLTATVIDVIALYIVPNKENYRQYVFDESPEFIETPPSSIKGQGKLTGGDEDTSSPGAKKNQ